MFVLYIKKIIKYISHNLKYGVFFLLLFPALTFAQASQKKLYNQMIDNAIKAYEQTTGYHVSPDDEAMKQLKTDWKTQGGSTNIFKRFFGTADTKQYNNMAAYLNEFLKFKNHMSQGYSYSVDNTVAINVYGHRFWGMDSDATNTIQIMNKYLNTAVKDGYLTKEQYEIEKNRILQVLKDYNKLVTSKIEASDMSNEEKADKISDIEAGVEAAAEALNDDTCPEVSSVRTKYTSGCWSCFVVGKLIETFLNVASKAYSVSQRAGLVLLLIGSGIWIATWGLKNVSSLSQIDSGNILNELIKFLFKFALAYFFITSGVKMAGKYIVNPIMGTGATIAQQFWDDTIKPSTVDFDWEGGTDEEMKSLEKIQKDGSQSEAIADEGEQKTEEASAETPKEYSEQENALLASQKPTAVIANDIPDFQLPGCSNCRLTSPSGPRATCGGTCSGCHKGADFGAATPKVEGDPIWAIAEGCVWYKFDSNDTTGKTGGGFYAIVEHKTIGNKTWKSLYMHMQPRSRVAFGGFDDKGPCKGMGKFVKKGQQIGYMGNTGKSTGAHLHLEIHEGSKRYSPVWIAKKIKVDPTAWCTSGVAHPEDQWAGFKQNYTVPSGGFSISGSSCVNLSMTYTRGGENGSGSSSSGGSGANISVNIPEFKYNGPTDIMSKSVINSIIGATKVITDTMAENMVLGDALICYSSLDKGGAWHFSSIPITNFILWLEGAFIWVSGFLLTLSVAYYLLDICYKIGFAVIALPLVVGLWPFQLTKDKFAACIKIITHSAATFAFLAMTTSYGMQLIGASLDSDGGLTKIYEAIDAASSTGAAVGDSNVQYVLDHMDLFSINFILLLFALLYTYKLIGATIPKLVNKFFPDGVFGDQSPMHHWSTAATKFAVDVAKKPLGYARDVALHQTGRLAKGGVKVAGKGIGNVAKKAWNKLSGKNRG